MNKIKIKNFEYEKYINYALIAYAFCLPISKAGTNVFESISIILWLLNSNFRLQYKQYKTNNLLLGISLFVAWSLISVLWVDDKLFALNYIMKYRHFLIIFVIFDTLKEENIKHIFSAFLLGMFISEIMSYAIFFEIIHYKNILPSDPSPFMSHTDYSIYLAFTSILLLTRIFDTKELEYKLIYIFFFVSVTTNLFVNGGRTGQITFIILILINFLHQFKNKIKALIISTLLLLIIFSLAINFSPVFQVRSYQLKADVEKIVLENNFTGSFGQRIALWRLGLERFKDNFLLGTGIGNDMNGINEDAKKLGFVLLNKHYGDNHNTFITVAVQLGIIGLLSIIFIFYSIISLKFTTYRYKVLNLTFFVAFTLWSMGGITFHTMNPMIFFSLFAGLFNKISYYESKKGYQ